MKSWSGGIGSMITLSIFGVFLRSDSRFWFRIAAMMLAAIASSRQRTCAGGSLQFFQRKYQGKDTGSSPNISPSQRAGVIGERGLCVIGGGLRGEDRESNDTAIPTPKITSERYRGILDLV